VTKLSEDFVANLALSDASQRCREIIATARWTLQVDEPGRIVARNARGSATKWPSRIEVLLEDAGPGLTATRLNGQIFGYGPLQKKYLTQDMAKVQQAMAVTELDHAVSASAVEKSPSKPGAPAPPRSPSFSISALTIQQARIVVVAGAACAVAAWFLVPWFSITDTSVSVTFTFKATEAFKHEFFIQSAGLYAPILIGLGALTGDRFAGTWRGLFMFAAIGPLYVGGLYSFFKIPSGLQALASSAAIPEVQAGLAVSRSVGPFLMLAGGIVMFLGALQIEAIEKAADVALKKTCPKCASVIPSVSEVCAHCGHSFEAQV
jgi:hypothetical protein